jgi:lysozyme family protein
MWGVTKRNYDVYRRRRGLEPQDVRLMTPAERDDIYHSWYWSPPRADDLPAGVDYCVFDGAINSGVVQSAKWLQRALGVADDGQIGDHTLLAASEANPHEVIKSICDQRRAFMRRLKTFKTFGDGWLNRVDDVESIARAMASRHGHEPQPHVSAAEGGAKAPATDIAPPAVSPSTATATTAATSAGAATVQQIQDQLSPFSDTLSVMKYVLLACAVIGVGLTIYSIWKNAKLKEVT